MLKERWRSGSRSLFFQSQTRIESGEPSCSWDYHLSSLLDSLLRSPLLLRGTLFARWRRLEEAGEVEVVEAVEEDREGVDEVGEDLEVEEDVARELPKGAGRHLFFQRSRVSPSPSDRLFSKKVDTCNNMHRQNFLQSTNDDDVRFY